MDKKLTNNLYKKYPKIFKQKDLSITQSAMGWGFQCSDGWYWLIDNLCAQLQWDIDHNKQPQIEATTVKEKFGGLRFYVTGSNSEQEATIDFAEFLSLTICEECGSTRKVNQNKKGYIKTLCLDCRRKEK